jgi:probable HAF family extracellular repeat protein
MKRRSTLTTLATPLLTTLALVPSARLCAQQAYTLTDLAAPGKASFYGSPTVGINASGQVVGSTTDASGANRAFRWTPSSPNAATGVLTLLALPKGDTASDARSINRLGQVAGDVYNRTIRKTTTGSAVRWEANGTVTTLFADGSGFAINDAGEIAGRTGDNKGYYPFLWVNGTTYNLKAQGVGWLVWGMNASGQLVGWDQTNNSLGYLWTPSKPNGTSGSSIQLPFQAQAVSDSGQVVGGNGHAVLYSSGTVLDLGTLPGFDGSGAYAINNSGQVVGEEWNSITGEGHVMLWDSIHGMRNLDDPTQFTLYNPDGTLAVGWELGGARGINDRGQIVGLGNNPAGQQRIILLTPVP